MMDDLREKVMKGLEMHASGMCNVVTTSNGREYCPYWENNDNCMVALLKDALSLLKAQAPRVLTIAELWHMEHKAVYLERKNSRLYMEEYKNREEPNDADR